MTLMAVTIREYGAWRLRGQSVVDFNVGCFPWHGRIELSVLTADELDSDPVLREPGEMAAWFHYNIGIGLSAWNPVELGRQMSDAYYSAAEDAKSATTKAFMRACQVAAESQEVAAALGTLGRDPRFRVTVDCADDGRDPYPPGGTTEAEPDAAADGGA